MADVVKTRGSLYFLRDIDYLSGKKGAYVKIGIVRKDKSTEARIKEHQTGNPRGIFDEYTLADVPFVEALETHLHYHFNEKWIAGEWFHMDENFVKEVVVKEAKRLRKEQLKFEDQIYAAEALSTQVSNGKKRKATAAELKLKAKYSKTKLEADIADAYLKIARSTLLQTIGNTGFIEGVFHLTKSKDSLKFDASAFKKENVSEVVAADISKKLGTRVEVRPTLVSNPVMYRILVGPEHKDQIINVIADLMDLGISDYFLTQG